jgi:hypothetical protein
MKDMTWSDFAAEQLRKSNSPYLDFFHKGLELQFMPVQDDDALDRWSGIWPISGHPHAKRIPAHGDCNPKDNDSVIDFHPNLIACFGTSWWNWRDCQTEGCFFDFDFGHGGKALDEEGILLTDQWAAQLPYVQCCTSRSGHGRHWLVRLGTPLPAENRKEHSRNCNAIKQRISGDLGFDIGKYVCSFGGIQYLYCNP